MSNNCHIQTGNCMLIAVALNASCEIVAATPTFVTAGVGQASGDVERQEGTDYSAPNFGGAECGPTQVGETIEKWMNLEGEFCLIDWSFMSATSGNPKVVDGDGNTVGFARLAKRSAGACVNNSKPRVAVIIVRRSATGEGGCVSPTEDTGATSAVGHFLSNTTDWLWDVPPWEDARALVPFTAKGYPNPNIGAGPLNLWPAAYTPNVVPADAYHAEAFLNPEDLPAINCDTPIAHPAIDDRSAP